MSDEAKRIYVVVAETVDTPNGVVVQPCGRAMAQACHVVSKMQIQQRIDWHHKYDQMVHFLSPPEECTTIILTARDSKELEHVNQLLMWRDVRRHTFSDTNDAVYGENLRVMTAICTNPVLPADVYGILDYLPLWSHGKCI